MHILKFSQKKVLPDVQTTLPEWGECTSGSTHVMGEGTFSAGRCLDQLSISRILHDGLKLMTNDILLLSTANGSRYAAVPRLEKILLKWICDQNSREVVLNSELEAM